MAIRNIYIAPKKGEEKPLEICELEGQGNMPASIGNFFLGESEMKKVAEKIAKSLTNLNYSICISRRMGFRSSYCNLGGQADMSWFTVRGSLTGTSIC